MFPQINTVAAMDFPDRDPDRNFNLRYAHTNIAKPSSSASDRAAISGSRGSKGSKGNSENRAKIFDEKSNETATGPNETVSLHFGVDPTPSECPDIVLGYGKRQNQQQVGQRRSTLVFFKMARIVFVAVSMAAVCVIGFLLFSMFNPLDSPLYTEPDSLEVGSAPCSMPIVSFDKSNYGTLVIRADADNSTFSVSSPSQPVSTPSFSDTTLSTVFSPTSSSLFSSSTVSSQTVSSTFTSSSSSASPSSSSSALSSSFSSVSSFSSAISTLSSDSSSSVTSFSGVSTSTGDGVTYVIGSTATQTFGTQIPRTLTLTSSSTANPSLSTESRSSNKGLSSSNKKVVIGCVVGIVGGFLFLALAVFAYFRFYKQYKDERFINSEGLWVTRNGNPDEKLNSAHSSPNQTAQSPSWKFWSHDNRSVTGNKSPVLQDEDNYQLPNSDGTLSPTNRYTSQAF